MPVDASVFNNIHTFQDYNMANQDFLARQKAAQLDAASKANIYATQVLSAAAASGDQGAYENGLNTLRQQGIDTSSWAPDVQTAAQQAQAARLAQSPLGSLLNAGLKSQSNQIALGGLTGQVPEGAANPLGALGVLPGLVTAPPSPEAKITRNSPPLPTNMNLSEPESSPTYTRSDISSIVANTPEDKTPTIGGQQFLLAPNTPSTAPASSTSRFSPSPQNPGETIAAYNQRVQREFEAYKEDPSVVAAKEGAKTSATETAKKTSDAVDKSNKATTAFDAISKNLDALEKLNPTVPTGNYMAPEIKGYLDKRLGSGEVNKQLSTWNEVNQQQVINGLKQLVESGQIRGNQFVEKIINRGYAVDPDADVATRQQQLTALRNELANSATAAQNNAADYTGAPKKEYKEILPSAKISKEDAINELRRRGKI